MDHLIAQSDADAALDPSKRKEALRALVRSSAFDFFDFGCSMGSSITWAKRKLGGLRGLGIDRSAEKLKIAAEAGHEVFNGDVLDLPNAKLVRFTTMRHLLEHVPDRATVYRILKRACRVSKEFVVIVQPNFDVDGLLLREGFKLYWSDWSGHPYAMSTLELYRYLKRLRDEGDMEHFSIYSKGLIQSSADPCIHPLSSPGEQHEYDPSIHPPKRTMKFVFPVYRETIAIIGITARPDPKIARAIAVGSAIVEV